MSPSLPILCLHANAHVYTSIQNVELSTFRWSCYGYFCMSALARTRLLLTLFLLFCCGCAWKYHSDALDSDYTSPAFMRRSSSIPPPPLLTPQALQEEVDEEEEGDESRDVFPSLVVNTSSPPLSFRLPDDAADMDKTGKVLAVPFVNLCLSVVAVVHCHCCQLLLSAVH